MAALVMKSIFQELISRMILLIEIAFLLLRILYLTFVDPLYQLIIPARRKSVAGEIVLITGAGHGVGKQLALRFAHLGAKTILWDINQEAVEAVAQEIRGNGGIAHAYHCDVSNEKQVERLAQQVIRDVGDVNILVNNAGIVNAVPLLSLNDQQIRRTMDVNALAHMWTIRQFLPGMLHLGHGHIVCISSQAGLIGSPFLVDYCASKHAIVGIMDALEEELYALKKEDQVQLTTICPLGINTGLIKGAITRFPSILPALLDVESVADQMVDAILKNERLVEFPRVFGIISKILSPFPRKVKQLVLRFLGYSIQPHIDLKELKY